MIFFQFLIKKLIKITDGGPFNIYYINQTFEIMENIITLSLRARFALVKDNGKYVIIDLYTQIPVFQNDDFEKGVWRMHNGKEYYEFRSGLFKKKRYLDCVCKCVVKKLR